MRKKWTKAPEPKDRTSEALSRATRDRSPRVEKSAVEPLDRSLITGYVILRSNNCPLNSHIKNAPLNMKSKPLPLLATLICVSSPSFLLAQPINDNFANPIDLPSASSFQSTFSSQNATSEPGEEMQSTFHGSIWFQWVAPATGIAIFEASGKYIDDRRMRPIIRVGQGSQLANLALVGVSTDVNDLAKLRFPVLQGQTYRVQIENGGGYPPANVTLGLARIDPITLPDFGVQSGAEYFYVPPRSNDNFAGAFNLAKPDAEGKLVYSSRFSATSSTVQASNEPGEDLFMSSAETVWFTWVAPTTGIATFEATGRYLDDDRFVPRIRVGQGNSVSGLPLAGISTDVNGQARLRIPVAKGQVYRIQVETGASYPSQTVTLNLTGIAAITHPDFGVLPKAAYFYTQPEANDSFAQAARLGFRDAQTGRIVYPSRFSATASIYQATSESGETLYSSSSGTLWFFWIAPATGIATFEATGRGTNDNPITPFVRVGQGTSVADFSLAGASRGDNNLSRLRIPVAKGELYRIQVEDRSSSYRGQTITLNLTGIAPITQADFGVQSRSPYFQVRPGANDNFSAAFRVATRDAKTKRLVYPSRFSVTAPVSQAGTEPGEISNSRYDQTVWFAWVAPASGLATFEAVAVSSFGGPVKPVIRIGQGGRVSDPRYLAVSNSTVGNRARSVVRVQRGRTYRIQLECNTYSFAQTATLNLVRLR